MPSLNVRVYGILVHDQKILVSDEIIRGKFYTKFPGGGLEFGEGTQDCLRREFAEETGLQVEVAEHIYTTDFFQPSAFHSDHQIISIYYQVKCDDISLLKTSDVPFGFSEEQLNAKKDCEVFRWIPLQDISEASVSLPIDKIVVNILTGEH